MIRSRRGEPLNAQPESPKPIGTMHVAAPAKVNLTLAVLGRRPDGFHELESWVVRVDWCDDLFIEAADDWTFTVESPHGGDAPADDSNLVCRAASALAAASGHPRTSRVRLVKHVPSGAGLGGGSSDAAAALTLLNALWGLNWPIPRLAEVGATVGSDVPLFLGTASAVLRGRGERVEPAACDWRGWLVLIGPRFGVATADVYREHAQQAAGRIGTLSDAVRSGATPARPSLSEIWRRIARDKTGWEGVLFNDLEPAAFACEPRLAALHAAIDGLQGRPVRMTGSGSCLFSVFLTEADAAAWAVAASARIQLEADIKIVRTL